MENDRSELKRSYPCDVLQSKLSHYQMMDPYLESYAKEFEGKVKFIRVNITDNLVIAAKYGVLATPTFKLSCKGRPIQHYVGEMSLIKKMVEDGPFEQAQCVEKASRLNPNITGYE